MNLTAIWTTIKLPLTAILVAFLAANGVLHWLTADQVSSLIAALAAVVALVFHDTLDVSGKLDAMHTRLDDVHIRLDSMTKASHSSPDVLPFDGKHSE